MTTIEGTVTGVQLVSASFGGLGSRKVYHVTASFGAYTASGDDAAILTLPTVIGNFTKNGKTVTLRGAMPGQPGQTAAGAAVYASPTITVDGASLEFNLGGVTAEANCAASVGVGIYVAVDES
jgi:hypothetical protein